MLILQHIIKNMTKDMNWQLLFIEKNADYGKLTHHTARTKTLITPTTGRDV